VAEPWALVADPGIDDAVALAVLAGSGEVPDLVVSEAGNVSGAVAARNAAGLVVLLGLTCPVVAHEVDAPPAVRPGRGSRHGDDGLGGVADRLPAAPEPGPVAGLPLSFLVTGPLAAVEAVEAVERLVWMGGALGSGNITATAEFNAWCAPAAADDVFQRHGAVTSVVPLDVTTQVPLGEEELEAWSGGGVTARLLADAVRMRLDRGRAVVHDAVAAVAWLRPGLFGWDRYALRCLTDGDDRGRVVAEPGGPTAVAVDVDADAVRGLVKEAVLACP
jgi:pyrimidine-specific ribonucleoside hydrolase